MTFCRSETPGGIPRSRHEPEPEIEWRHRERLSILIGQGEVRSRPRLGKHIADRPALGASSGSGHDRGNERKWDQQVNGGPQWHGTLPGGTLWGEPIN